MNMTIDEVKMKAMITIANVKGLIEICEELGLTNEQWFLDALDDLNKLSVKY